MQASTSKLPALAKTCYRQCARSASSSAKSKRLAQPPAPNALTLTEAIHSLRSMSPGDTTSAYELTLLPRMATTVNINTLRGRSFLKHDASNSKKRDIILVFAEGEDAEKARREGADIVGGKELIDAILQSTVQPTKIISTPDQLPNLTRSTLPRVLGPKGLMPSVKRGTVTSNISQAIREARGGLDWLGVEAKLRSSAANKKVGYNRGQVSVPIGRLGFTDQQIKENISQFMGEVLDVCNGVGTQAEIDTKGGGKKNKRAEIEKLYLSTSKSMNIEVTDVAQLSA